MKIAILGGGLSGLSAAYELAKYKHAGAEIEVKIFEAGRRLGGLLETHRQDGFVIECGADSWVTEKPWANELAIELGLEDQLIGSSDQWRRTYLARRGHLEAMPDGMRMMVPINWAPLLASPLFSTEAKLAYLREPKRAEELKVAALALEDDESVRDFVARHFGEQIADNIAAPLLAGVFGGDIRSLSAQAVMPLFVKLAREQGSLIEGLQRRAHASTKRDSSSFTSLRNGLQTLPEYMAATLPGDWLSFDTPVNAIEKVVDNWRVHAKGSAQEFDALIVALPARTASKLLSGVDAGLAGLLEIEASSAIIVAMAFTPEQSQSIKLPRGFGFLVPQAHDVASETKLMATTFVDQKFTHRAPAGGIVLRAFFGGAAANELMSQSDEALTDLARRDLGGIIGTLSTAHITLVRRWPDSLPQYAVGHLKRVAEIERVVAGIPNLRVTGNAFHGVGMPDIIRQGRVAATSLVGQ